MRYIKPLISLIAACCILTFVVRDMRISHREKSPTHLAMDHWDQYHGERWLEVTCTLDMQRAVVKNDLEGRRTDPNNLWAYVPMVAENSDPTVPVHAVAVIGPYHPNNVSQILKDRSGCKSISGMISSEGASNARLMPDVKLDANVVFIHEGRKPMEIANFWFLIPIALGAIVFSLYRLARALSS